MSERPKSRFKAEREANRPAAAQVAPPPAGGQAAGGAASSSASAAAPRPVPPSPQVGGQHTSSSPSAAPSPSPPVQHPAVAVQKAPPPAAQAHTGAVPGGLGGQGRSTLEERGTGDDAGIHGGGGQPPGQRSEAGTGRDPPKQQQEHGTTPGGLRAGEAVQEKIARYEKFIDETLRIKLLQVQSSRVGLVSEMEAYERLGTTLKTIRDEKMETLRTSVNVGCDLYMQAMVPDTSRVMVDVGLGFYAEMTVEEGLAFVDKKVAHLQTSVDKKSQESAEISAQIDVVLQGINELMQA